MSRPIGLRGLPSPPTITLLSRVALGAVTGANMNFGSAVSGASPWSDAANCLLAFPFVLETQTTIYKGFCTNGASPGGNSEIGVWDDGFNKLVTTGSFANGTNNTLPVVAALSATVTLPPGLYYAGMAHDATTTAQLVRWSVATTGAAIWQSVGCWRQSGITLGSLAATATPGDMTNVAFPHFGLITRSVFDV